jgi:hypothetical protein
MKRSKSAKPSTTIKTTQLPKSGRGLQTPVDLQRFPLDTQADATPNRESVRELAHPVTAPRQTLRRPGKLKKSTTDS